MPCQLSREYNIPTTKSRSKQLSGHAASSLSGYLLSYLHGVVSCRKPHSIWYAVSPFWGYPDRLLEIQFNGCDLFGVWDDH
jgi:hypothetical protein